MPFKAVIGIVVAVILGKMLIDLGDTLYAATIGESDDSRANFDRVYSKIIGVIEDPDKEAETKINKTLIYTKWANLVAMLWVTFCNK